VLQSQKTQKKRVGSLSKEEEKKYAEALKKMYLHAKVLDTTQT